MGAREPHHNPTMYFSSLHLPPFQKKKKTTIMRVYSFLYLLLLFLFFFIALLITPTTNDTIVFSTLARSRFNFDIFSTSTSTSTSSITDEIQLTDGISVNYNGFFVSSSSNSSSPPSLVFVSERNGAYNIYLTSYQSLNTFTFPLLTIPNNHPSSSSMKDRPSVVNHHLVYASTHQPAPSPRQSWSAVYSTHLATRQTTRLTPPGVADFSPSVSPSGYWTAVASFGEFGWSGEAQELNTSIYVFRTADGLMRTRLIEHGGWPCWADDNTLYFHRESEDGWWSVYRATITTVVPPVVVSVERITSPGFHAFTPATSVGSPGIIAVATRREGSRIRHIELVDVHRNSYVEVTRLISPNSQHYNPFLSPDGTRVGYHRCNGGEKGSPPLLLENQKSPFPDMFSLFRIDGAFPAFSHDGSRMMAYVVYITQPGLYVASVDRFEKPRKLVDGRAFGVAWDWKRKGVIYVSLGPTFGSVTTRVDILSVTLENYGDENSGIVIKKLAAGGDNNAFPSPSPDGKWVVFRSGRSGYKNLYVMDAVEGENREIYRLTEGPWDDTMCNWSPDGEWIAFSSDRDNPGSGSFAIYMIHPNGTGLRKVVDRGHGGKANHPWFSPDSKKIVFTADYGGISSEPISNPQSYIPYGDIFTANIDGCDIQRITHNPYEDGTPLWSPMPMQPKDVAEYLEESTLCEFEDCVFLDIGSTSSGNNYLAGTRC